MKLGLLMLASLSALLLGSPAAGQPSRVNLFIPAFAGQQPLGLNVATVVNLRIWRTLRKAPTPNPAHLSFGDGTVIWSDDPMPRDAFESLDDPRRYDGSDMLLWGTADRYGDGAIAQTFLLARPLGASDAGGALWRVRVNGADLDLGLPRLMFDFGTLSLRREIIESYSRPNALRLCPGKTVNCAGTPVGNRLTARQHDGDWTLFVSDNGAKGWVRLATLGEEPNETVEFTGALIAYFRGDFDQAQRLFRQASVTAAADTLVSADARLLRAAALSRLHRPAAGEIDRVLADDPYSRYALQVAFMDALENRSSSSASIARIRALGAKVRRNRDLFAADDEWLRKALEILGSLGV